MYGYILYAEIIVFWLSDVDFMYVHQQNCMFMANFNLIEINTDLKTMKCLWFGLHCKTTNYLLQKLKNKKLFNAKINQCIMNFSN